MSGYQIGSNVATFVFDESIAKGAYKGLEVKVSLDCSLEDYFEYRRRRFLGDAAEQKAAAVWFGDSVLTAWNLKNARGEDMVATGEGFPKAPLRLAVIIMDRWERLLAGLDEGNDPNSSGGSTAT